MRNPPFAAGNHGVSTGCSSKEREEADLLLLLMMMMPRVTMGKGKLCGGLGLLLPREVGWEADL